MSASPYGRGLLGLLKKGWNEIPAVMATTGLALVGIGLSGYVYHVVSSNEIYTYKYKNDIMIVRPDDPRLNKPVNKYPE
uniref:Unkown protein n=1 Tax=Riptortus pedestris TaxID=329032 RepID=R4WP70_RIPPE|nr:unkown protein [Riptortus pedestris]